MIATDQIAIIYSTATGIVLRTVNPDENDQLILQWLKDNLPNGTSMLLLNKVDIKADDTNCPNLDVIIPYVQTSQKIVLNYGVRCVVVENDVVTNSVLCCPILYQNSINSNAIPVVSPDLNVVTPPIHKGKNINVVTTSTTDTTNVDTTSGPVLFQDDSASIGDAYDPSSGLFVSNSAQSQGS